MQIDLIKIDMIMVDMINTDIIDNEIIKMQKDENLKVYNLVNLDDESIDERFNKKHKKNYKSHRKDMNLFISKK